MKVVLLCGGVGGSKLALGLYHELPPGDLTVIINTADDLEMWGLHVSPDVDTVTYTLAGLAPDDRGWGIEGDRFGALALMERFGRGAWFQIGDRDLATHVHRTELLRSGGRLTEVTAGIARGLGVRAAILPMCDEPVSMRVRTARGWLSFQEYFVKFGHEDEPLGVELRGIDAASATPEVLFALAGADLVVVAPSNPVVSIGPILSVPGVRAALTGSDAPVVAVSPFIGPRSVSGPADALMRAQGHEPSPAGLADLYSPWLTTLVVHESDIQGRHPLETSDIRVVGADTLMPDLAAKRRLARFVLSLQSPTANGQQPIANSPQRAANDE